jgi:hypothetical protein
VGSLGSGPVACACGHSLDCLGGPVPTVRVLIPTPHAPVHQHLQIAPTVFTANHGHFKYISQQLVGGASNED